MNKNKKNRALCKFKEQKYYKKSLVMYGHTVVRHMK